MKYFISNIIDDLEVWSVSLAAIGLTTVDIKDTLKIVSLLAAISFTIYKWINIARENKNKDKNK